MCMPCEHFHLHGFEMRELQAVSFDFMFSIGKNCEVMCNLFDLHLHKHIHDPRHIFISLSGLKHVKCMLPKDFRSENPIFNKMNMCLSDWTLWFENWLGAIVRCIEHRSLPDSGSVVRLVSDSKWIPKSGKRVSAILPKYFNSIVSKCTL